MDNRRVDVAGAGSHHKSFQGCKAHGCIHRVTALNGAGGRAVAEVKRDDVNVFALDVIQYPVPVRDVTVRCAVKSVTPDFMTNIELVRNRV